MSYMPFTLENKYDKKALGPMLNKVIRTRHPQMGEVVDIDLFNRLYLRLDIIFNTINTEIEISLDAH